MMLFLNTISLEHLQTTSGRLYTSAMVLNHCGNMVLYLLHSFSVFVKQQNSWKAVWRKYKIQQKTTGIYINKSAFYHCFTTLLKGLYVWYLSVKVRGEVVLGSTTTVVPRGTNMITEAAHVYKIEVITKQMLERYDELIAGLS